MPFLVCSCNPFWSNMTPRLSQISSRLHNILVSSSSSNLKWISFISCLACSLELTSRPSRMAFHVSFRRLVLIISVYMCVVILKREKETKATQILLIWVIWCLTIIIYLLVGQAYKFARVGWWHIFLGWFIIIRWV